MKCRTVACLACILFVTSMMPAISCMANEETLLVIGQKPDPSAALQASDSTADETGDDHAALPKDGESEEEKALKIYHLRWTNCTGRGITGVQIKNIYSGQYPENMLGEGTVFHDGEMAVLYFDASDENKDAEFNVRITFEDGTVKDMTSFPFDDMEEAELRIDEDLVHAVYRSVLSGEEKDTLDREKALRNTAEMAKQEDYYEEEYDDWEDEPYEGNTGGTVECIGEGASVW